MNHCSGGGFTVSPTRFLPEDLTDHGIAQLPLVGCNRLRCSKCGAWVRNVIGRAPVAGVSLAQAYGEDDLAGSPKLEAYAASHRFYLCCCSGWFEHIEHAMDDPVEDIRTDPDLPWRCAGHPLVELPHEIDGVRVEAGEALAELARRALGGFEPAGMPSNLRGEASWPVRLCGRLAGTEHQAVVVREALAAMTAPDPRVRAMALRFFVLVHSPDAIRRALELLQGDRELFAGIPDPVTRIEGETLEDTLFRVLMPAVEGLEGVRRLFRDEARASGKGRKAVYAALVRHDPDWVIDHAAEIVSATPARADQLLESGQILLPRKKLAALRESVARAHG